MEPSSAASSPKRCTLFSLAFFEGCQPFVQLNRGGQHHMEKCLFHDCVVVPVLKRADSDGVVPTSHWPAGFALVLGFAIAVVALVQDSAGTICQHLEFQIFL